MVQYFKDYYWKDAIPYGIAKFEVDDSLEGNSEQIYYKIVMDPYRKYISIEQYGYGQFVSLIYNSLLLDFRTLQPAKQAAWQKSVFKEDETSTVCLIRNQDDRIVFIETYFFEQNLCRECQVHSPHKILLSTQKIQYVKLGAPLNQVSLYDANDHLIMSKCYLANEETGEFTELLSEKLDCRALL